MNIVVPLQQTPDLVEELEINADGTDIDRDAVTLQLSEWDGQALEEALLLKEAGAGSVTAVTIDGGEADAILFTALAKGVDRAVKLKPSGDAPTGLDHHALARLLAAAVAQLGADLVLTGVQSVEDLDGQLPVLLAAMLGWPHVSVVTGTELRGGAIAVKQEYSGGVMAELEARLPAVIGIQAARQAPRYAPVSKVRQIQKTAKLEEMPVEAPSGEAGLKIRRVFKPEIAGRAEILEGEPAEIAAKLVSLLKDRGLAI
ncbi:MAG: electron transfer flavoprotein subunit beta/FixA family protein [Deltaproteobacteria bacterium]|nr:electron transfer flavoprotein subunit beta/FixA family protein [Deltaproteobacteria bacterium]